MCQAKKYVKIKSNEKRVVGKKTIYNIYKRNKNIKGEKKMSKFFAFLNRMKYIKRWSLMRSVREENIMEHSLEVSIIAHALAIIKNKRFGGSVNIEKVVLLAQDRKSVV